MATLRPPSAWADAQREFHLAYDRDPTGFIRHPVAVRWLTRGELDPYPEPDQIFEGIDRPQARGAAPLIGIPHVLGGFFLRLLSAWRLGTVPHDGLEVTVVDAFGDRMSFTVDPEIEPLQRKGETLAILVGEIGMNAVACLEIDGQVLWPTMPPVVRPEG